MISRKSNQKAASTSRIFVGGVPIKMDEKTLRDYFSGYGQVSYFKLAKNKKTKEPLGFGFLEFSDETVAHHVLQEKHIIHGREIDVKPFKKGNDINKQDEDLKRRKVFVKGLPSSCDKFKLYQTFIKFGEIDKTYILYDHNSGSSRGFGFVEYCKEEDAIRAIEVPVSIDGKVVKCSRVILKQEVKQTNLPEAKPVKGFGGHNYSQAAKRPSQTKGQKNTKSKKKPKIAICSQADDNGSQGDATKESSQSNSCEKTDQTYTFNQCARRSNASCHYEQTAEYESARYLTDSTEYGLFHRQSIYPDCAIQDGNFALNCGWKPQDQFGDSGNYPGNPFDHRLGQQKQDWFQSSTQVGSKWTYRTGMHQSQVGQNQSKKTSYYRMF